nr:unnamed protein product [Callosobruchus chinensis]
MAVMLACMMREVPRVQGETPATHMKSIQFKNKGADKVIVELTGEEKFELPAGQSTSVILNDTWTGTVSAQVATCRAEICDGAPHTTAVIQFGGPRGATDQYYVSLEKGFNLPMKIQATKLSNFCKMSTCVVDIKAHCPKHLQILDDDEQVVACKHDIELFRTHCPHVVITEEDPKHSNVLTCNTSNTFLVTLGELSLISEGLRLKFLATCRISTLSIKATLRATSISLRPLILTHNQINNIKLSCRCIVRLSELTS